MIESHDAINASDIPSGPVALVVGDGMPLTTVGPLTRTDFVRYAGASGDFNPAHHDELIARDAGAPSVFGMGMLHAGMLGTMLARWVGPDAIRTFGVRFTGQVWPGDELTFSGTVLSVDDSTSPPTAALELNVASQSGQTVLKGSALVAIVRREPS